MEQDVGQFDVTMDNSEGPDIFNAMYHLLDYNSRLFLPDVSTCLQQYSKVKPIRVLLHHVYIGACFNCLVKADGMVAPYHSVNLYLLVDTIEVFLTDI